MKADWNGVSLADSDDTIAVEGTDCFPPNSVQRQIKVFLRPALESDRLQVYEWLTRSDVTPSMMGPPDYPDHPAPSWEEFCGDYMPNYFDDSDPFAGRCFIIVADGQDVGVVSYNAIEEEGGLTELDIWLGAEAYCGKGYGSNALEALCAHLHKAYRVEHFIIRPSGRNRRAIAAYKRAGFELLPLSPAEQTERFGEADYEDSVVLLKQLG